MAHDSAPQPTRLRPQTTAFVVVALLAVTMLAPLAAAGAISDLSTMSFARIGTDQGLSQGAITAVLQDRRGFLWLGTEDGLNRYDGHELKRFIHRRQDPASLPTNWISALTEDESGRLWVATDGGGLVWRDPADGSFRRPLGPDGQPLVDAQARIRTVLMDSQRRLWLGMRDGGLAVLDPKARSVRSYRHETSRPESLIEGGVFALAEDSVGGIWVGTATGLDRLKPDGGNFTHFTSMLGPSPMRVTAVMVDGRDIVWAGTDAGLSRLDPVAGSARTMRHREHDARSLPNDRVSALLKDDDQHVWVGTGAGLALLDRHSESFGIARNEGANIASLPDSNITSLYQDHSGLLWVGTKSGGAARWNPRSWQFGHRRFEENERNVVTSFVVDSHGTLWVGSFGGGLTTIDERGTEERVLRPDLHAANALADPNVMALAIDERDRIWLGTMGAGVERLDPHTGLVRRFGFDPKDPLSLPAPGIMCLLRGARSITWVGTYGGGLASIDAQDRIARYPVDREGETGLSSDRATALAEDATGLLWIGTDGGGLTVFNPSARTFRHFRHNPKDPNSLSADTVYSILPDAHGSVWVGTRGGGLDRLTGNPFSPAPIRFENLSESDGLPNSTIYGIVPDALGRLWLSTNRGLVAYDPSDHTLRSFRRSQGLQGDEFNFGAHYRSDAGVVYFGGTNGYNAFQPERLRFNTRPPPLALTEVLRVNTSVSATPESLANLRLGYRDNVVTFRFAALDFTGPLENRYQYRLEGFDEQWIDASNVGQASYTNLNGGRYVFRVRAANSDGVWNEHGIALPLNVAPAPWNTWWARALYALALLAIIGGIWDTQRRRIRREAEYAQRLRAEVAERTAEIHASHQQLELANSQLREASLTDPLTALGNRRYLREAMPALLATAGTRHVVIVVDLDHLKPINDQHGHDAGDAALLKVAGILRQLFRSTDLIVRWGGDEFVVVCVGCDLPTAGGLAERVRAAVAKAVFRVADDVTVRCSCSIGFASMPFIEGAPSILGWEQSITLADAALYRAKRSRNTWFGWGARAVAAQIPSLLSAIDLEADALERSGVLEVHRPPPRGEDTVDSLRILA